MSRSSSGSSQTVILRQISTDQRYTGQLELTSEEINQNKEIVCFAFRAFSAEARRDNELSDEEVTSMSYEPKLDETQQTQLTQLSAVAGDKIRKIAKICNAHLKEDEELQHVDDQVLCECIKTDKNEVDFDQVKRHLRSVISEVFSTETLEKCRDQPSMVIIYLALVVYYCFDFCKKLMHKKLCTIFPEWVVQFICSSITILVKRLAEIAFNHFIQKYGGWSLLLNQLLPTSFAYMYNKWIIGTVGLVLIGVAVYHHLSEK